MIQKATTAVKENPFIEFRLDYLDKPLGAFPAIKSYVIVVLGGLGSIWGSMAAALLLGVLESFFAVYVSYDYRDAFGLLVLILVLLFRPQGLSGEKGREV